MSTQLANRSPYVTGTLNPANIQDLKEMAEQSAKIGDLAKISDQVVAQIATHALDTTRHFTQEADAARRRMLEAGHRSQIYDDVHDKMIEVTATNLLAVANTAQKEVMSQMVKYLR